MSREVRAAGGAEVVAREGAAWAGAAWAAAAGAWGAAAAAGAARRVAAANVPQPCLLGAGWRVRVGQMSGVPRPPSLKPELLRQAPFSHEALAAGQLRSRKEHFVSAILRKLKNPKTKYVDLPTFTILLYF